MAVVVPGIEEYADDERRDEYGHILSCQEERAHAPGRALLLYGRFKQQVQLVGR